MSEEEMNSQREEPETSSVDAQTDASASNEPTQSPDSRSSEACKAPYVDPLLDADPARRETEKQEYRNLINCWNAKATRTPASPISARARPNSTNINEVFQEHLRRVEEIQAGPAGDSAREWLKRAEQRSLNEKIQLMASKCEIPDSLRKADLDDLSALPDDAIATYRRFAHEIWDLVSRQRSRAIVIVISSGGHGKSHIIAGIIKRFILGRRLEDGPKFAKYTTSQRMTRQFLKVGTTGEAKEFERWSRHPFLAIDEIDKQLRFPSDLTRVQDLIRERYEIGLPTLVAGNAAKEELPDLLGPPNVDRSLAESDKLFVCDWKPVRGRLKSCPTQASSAYRPAV